MAKKFWLVLSAALASALVIFLAVGITADAVLKIERSVQLDPGMEDRVLGMLKDLERWDEWNPWLGRPEISTEVRRNAEGDERLTWTGGSLPEGHIRLTDQSDSMVEYERVFEGFSTTPGRFELKKANGNSTLVWGFERNLGKPMGFILKGIFRPEAERLFDEGLANLVAGASSDAGADGAGAEGAE